MSADVPELIPVRMLNEFAYCPRLAYLEWVEGEFRDNLETLEGRFGHRRVDEPTKASFDVPDVREEEFERDQETKAKPGFWRRTLAPPRGKVGELEPSEEWAGDDLVRDVEAEPVARRPVEEETIHARSLMLSAPKEGLIAKLDLLEVEGDVATPVDYKRGKAPDLREGAWEPERVQLCAQGLILREVGYRSDYGVIYFIASKRRVEIPFDEALIARTRQLVAQFRKAAALDHAPPPLVDSPKCPRCSLVGICLPDETNLLQLNPSIDAGEDQDGPLPTSAQPNGLKTAPSIRRLMPARDDALPLYINEQGSRLGKNGERLQIQSQGKTLSEVKLMDVSQVSLFGNVQVSSQALRELTSRGVPVCHFSYGGWFQAITTGMMHKNIDLRQKQFAIAADAKASLHFARQFIAGKVKNCRTLLRRNLSEKKEACLNRLAESYQDVLRTDNAETLLGLEGMAAKVYFENFGRMLKAGETFQVNGRNRRPPTDPVNCILSFLYAMLCKDLTVTLQAVGFDPMLGFFHRPRYGRPSLALDLAEEFRPLIADSTALMLINNGEVKESSFIRRAGAVALTKAGRRAVIESYERRMDSLATHPIFGYRISYRRILEVQARLLARTVAGELEQYPNYCTR